MYEPPVPVLTATEHPPPPESLERLIVGGGAAALIVALTVAVSPAASVPRAGVAASVASRK